MRKASLIHLEHLLKERILIGACRICSVDSATVPILITEEGCFYCWIRLVPTSRYYPYFSQFITLAHNFFCCITRWHPASICSCNSMPIGIQSKKLYAVVLFLSTLLRCQTHNSLDTHHDTVVVVRWWDKAVLWLALFTTQDIFFLLFLTGWDDEKKHSEDQILFHIFEFLCFCNWLTRKLLSIYQ